METLKKRLTDRLKTVREDKNVSKNSACEKCIDELIKFVETQKKLDKFDDFEFDGKCEMRTGKRGQKWCYGEVILLVKGKDRADLVFKMMGMEFDAILVDLDNFENNYGLF